MERDPVLRSEKNQNIRKLLRAFSLAWLVGVATCCLGEKTNINKIIVAEKDDVVCSSPDCDSHFEPLCTCRFLQEGDILKISSGRSIVDNFILTDRGWYSSHK